MREILFRGERVDNGEWVQAAFTFRWKRFNLHGGDSFKECVLADFGKFYDLKLIGNIHDNPELLKGGE